jgi:hypothetical protein
LPAPILQLLHAPGKVGGKNAAMKKRKQAVEQGFFNVLPYAFHRSNPY